MTPWRGVGLIAVLLAVWVMSGCGADAVGDQAPHRVTTSESEVLATTRFRNFDAGTRAISTDLMVGAQTLHIAGFVDYAQGIGYALVTGADTPTSLLRWRHAAIAVQESPGADLPLPMPRTGWQTRDLDPSGSVLDAVAKILIELGDDRPENPLLLQQQGAMWLRADTIDGTAVSVFAAPASTEVVTGDPDPDAANLRLWVDEGGVLLRAEIRTSPSAGWTTVDFSEATGVEIGTWK